MRTSRTLLGLAAALVGLGCAGIVPLEEPAPPDPAVQELLDAERGDGAPLEGDALAARSAAVQAFLAATPDFVEWKEATLDCLEGDCAEQVEAAYARAKADYAAKPPVTAAVAGDAWQVLVVIDHVYAPTEDWSAFSAEVEQALPADRVAAVRAGLGVYGVSVQKDGAEVASIDLAPFASEREPVVGYVFAKSGADPQFQAHEMTSPVLTAACAYFALDPCPTADGAEDEGGEPAEEPAEEPAGEEPAGEEPAGERPQREWKRPGKAGKR